MNWIHNLLTPVGPPPAVAETITVGDRNRRLQVRLDPNLPDDAYQQLFHLDLSSTPAGVLTWDRAKHGWRLA
jgi:hypothetical protein